MELICKLDAVSQAQLPPQPRGEQNQLRVHVHAGDPECLDADLVKLALAAFLRSLIAEHGAAVPQPLGHTQQAVLDRSAHATGGALRPQGQVFAIAVIEAVHLLLDDVSHLADGALEQLGLLHHGQADLAIAVTGQQPTHGAAPAGASGGYLPAGYRSSRG